MEYNKNIFIVLNGFIFILFAIYYYTTHQRLTKLIILLSKKMFGLYLICISNWINTRVVALHQHVEYM